MRYRNLSTVDPVIKFYFSTLKRHSVYFGLSSSDLNCFKGYWKTVFATVYQIKEII